MKGMSEAEVQAVCVLKLWKVRSTASTTGWAKGWPASRDWAVFVMCWEERLCLHAWWDILTEQTDWHSLPAPKGEGEKGLTGDPACHLPIPENATLLGEMTGAGCGLCHKHRGAGLAPGRAYTTHGSTPGNRGWGAFAESRHKAGTWMEWWNSLKAGAKARTRQGQTGQVGKCC